jgi:carbon starvation protein
LLIAVLVIGAIVVGPYVPFDVAQLSWNAGGHSDGIYAAGAAGDVGAITNQSYARKGWDIVLLLYCLGAGVAPVWLILQPRGQLGGYFLYAALAAGAIGLILGGAVTQYPAFRGWEVAKAGTTEMQPLFPLLFGPNAPDPPSTSVCESVNSNDTARRGVNNMSPTC